MPNILDAVAGTAEFAAVAQEALCDLLFVAAAVVLVVLLSRLLETVVVSLIALVAGSGAAMLVESYLTFPGVVYHELSHALFALVTGARVKSISLRHKRTADGYILGSVSYVPRGGRVLQAFQLFLTGVAPTLTGLAGMAAIANFAFPACTETWQTVVWAYLFACLLLHSGLSRQDLEGMYAGAPIVLLIFFAVFLFVPFDATGAIEGILSTMGLGRLLAGV